MPAEKETTYTFTHDGATYHLPASSTAVPHITGKVLRDAFMDGDEGQLRLGFTLLEHVDADEGAIDALYSMPAPDMLEHVKEWMQFTAGEDDASLGE